jgi:hypothetical protein
MPGNYTCLLFLNTGQSKFSRLLSLIKVKGTSQRQVKETEQERHWSGWDKRLWQML